MGRTGGGRTGGGEGWMGRENVPHPLIDSEYNFGRHLEQSFCNQHFLSKDHISLLQTFTSSQEETKKW